MESQMSFKQNNYYVDLFEENQNIIIIIETETGKIVHANKAACLFYNYNYEELIALNIVNLNSLSEEEIDEEVKQAKLEQRKYYKLSHQLSNKEIRQVEVFSTPIILNNKEYLYIIIYDIQNQKSQEIMVTKAFYESPNAMVILDNNKNVLAVNKSFSNLFGYKPEDFHDHSLKELITNTTIGDEVTENLFKVLHGEIVNLNSIRYGNQAQAIEVNIIATPYIINKEIIGAMIVYSDITEQNQIRKELVSVKEQSIQDLKDAKNRLQLILDSTVEAIFGIDEHGICTFCNNSVLKMLGYDSDEELLGKRIHNLIHHSYADGSPMPYDECKITQSIKNHESIHVEDEVFWKTDGSKFFVSYYSHPQLTDGKTVGTVVTFTDISERKQQEEHIKYVSHHDSLTNLYNRFYFVQEMQRLDKKENLPISIIFADIDGLKLTNDIFGHQVGDMLLVTAANIFRKIVHDCIIARVGGDEFTILLPKTSKKEATKILDKIRNEFQKERVEVIYNSISLGVETKVDNGEVIEKIMKLAETMMYNDKITNRKIVNANMIEEIISNLHNKSPREKEHSKNVSLLAASIAKEIGMSENEVRKTRDAAYLHDIGKIVLDENILNNQGIRPKEDKELLKQHTVIGYRILNLFDETIDLAEIVLNHHEYYNGTGYPKGLVGDDIPIIARVIAVAEAYDSRTNIYNYTVLDKTSAIEEISRESGGKYDPDIIEIMKHVLK